MFLLCVYVCGVCGIFVHVCGVCVCAHVCVHIGKVSFKCHLYSDGVQYDLRFSNCGLNIVLTKISARIPRDQTALV